MLPEPHGALLKKSVFWREHRWCTVFGFLKQLFLAPNKFFLWTSLGNLPPLVTSSDISTRLTVSFQKWTSNFTTAATVLSADVFIAAEISAPWFGSLLKSHMRWVPVLRLVVIFAIGIRGYEVRSPWGEKVCALSGKFEGRAGSGSFPWGTTVIE